MQLLGVSLVFILCILKLLRAEFATCVHGANHRKYAHSSEAWLREFALFPVRILQFKAMRGLLLL